LGLLPNAKNRVPPAKRRARHATYGKAGAVLGGTR
jgi:hypothetical protein